MRNYLTTNDIAIITNDKVEKSFNNIDCQLYAVIRLKNDDNENRRKTFEVRTDLVAYKESKVVNDVDDTGVIDNNNEPNFEIISKLSFVEQKQGWSMHTFSYDEINALAEKLDGLIPDGLNEIELEHFKLAMIFLQKRREDSPCWGIDSSQWRKVTSEDYIK